MKSILFDNFLLGKVQQNPGTTCIFNFPVSVLLYSNNKADRITILPVNLMLIKIYYHIILILGDYDLLGGFKHKYDVHDVYGVGAKFVECRYDEYFILYAGHEC